MDRMEATLGRVADSLQALVKLEAQYGETRADVERLVSSIAKQNDRLQAIEVHMPGLIETRRWVVLGLLAGVGMMGAALLKMVLLP